MSSQQGVDRCPVCHSKLLFVRTTEDPDPFTIRYAWSCPRRCTTVPLQQEQLSVLQAPVKDVGGDITAEQFDKAVEAFKRTDASGRNERRDG